MNDRRECPKCLKDRVCSLDSAQRVFDTGSWHGDFSDAEYVCSWCHAARVDGRWKRIESVRDRAYTLAQSSSNSEKDTEYYMREMQKGEA